MRLRSHLSILVVAAVVPLLIFSTVMVFVFNKQQRAAVENSLLDTARALSLAIDREITASIHTLEALATSDDLDSGDLGKFYEQAARVLKAREDWDNILLADSSGRQLLNLRRPFGSPLPPVGELEEFQRVIKTSRPVVSDLYFGRVSQKYLIGVSAPVVRKGKARYVLMSSRRPMSLLRILAQQNIAPHWLGTIADNKGIIVARTRNIEQMIGKAAMPVPPPMTKARTRAYRSALLPMAQQSNWHFAARNSPAGPCAWRYPRRTSRPRYGILWQSSLAAG